nr:MAG TPA: hypothetical protein [Caudoviricetes sp.]
MLGTYHSAPPHLFHKILRPIIYVMLKFFSQCAFVLYL